MDNSNLAKRMKQYESVTKSTLSIGGVKNKEYSFK